MISKRLLWVHGAAYPLENIVRVHTFYLTPRRGAAFGRFLKRGGSTLLVLVFLMWISDSSSRGWGSSSDLADVLEPLMVVVGGVLIYFFVEMLAVLFAATHHVLAVETNGLSTALVTAPREQLTELVLSIAEAIDKPDAELHAHVAAPAVTNYGNYYFGDAVNIYGGSGNTGVSK